MSRWSRKTDEEKAAAAEKQKVHCKSKAEEFEEIRRKSYDQVIKNGEIPLFCTRVRLFSGANNYTIEETDDFFHQVPVPMYVGVCRCCKQVHKTLLVGDPMTSVLLAQIAFTLMEKGKLVDKRRMKDEPSRARKETH